MKNSNNKKALSLILTLALVISLFSGITITASATPTVWNGTAANAFAGGSGTSNDPYQIATAEQLAYFKNQVNSGVDYYNRHIKLTDDILLNSSSSLSANSWSAIGTSDNPFEGTFDGNGHYICNIYFYSPNSSAVTHKGLFGSTGTSAVIKRLGITGTIGAYNYAGGIVGYNTGLITDCFSAVSVTGNDSGTRGSGGIAGVNNGTIEYCYNIGTVNNLYRPAGGITGNNYSNAAAIRNCYSIGNITSAGGSGYAGAITATQNGTVSNCYYLTGTASTAFPYPSSSTTGSSSETTMKGSAFVTTLGSSHFKSDPNSAYNGGYPVLTWQNSPIPVVTASYTVSFSCTGASNISAAQSVNGVVTVAVNPTVNNATLMTVTVPASSGAYVEKTATNTFKISNIASNFTVAVNVVANTTSYTPSTSVSGVVDVLSTNTFTINGNSSNVYHDLTISCTGASASALVINNLRVSNDNVGVLDFTGTGNTLTFSGTNVLDSHALTKANIRVPSGAGLTIYGTTNKLYLYKNAHGAAIGGAAGEANGTITINSGEIFAKGSGTGAVIGTGNNAASAAGTIDIKGGKLNIATVSNGAGIGGGVNGTIGTVKMSGSSNVNIVCDWNGAAIGVGNATTSAGMLYVEDASLFVSSTDNRTASDTYLVTAPTRSQYLGTAQLYPAAVPVPSSSTHKIYVDSTSLYYNGTPNNYTYVGSNTSTTANWTPNSANTIYIYMEGYYSQFVSVGNTGTYDYYFIFSNGHFTMM